MIMLSRRIATACSLMVAVIVVLGVGASAAFAETHPFLGPLGGSSSPDTFTNPNGIAVEESTGDVYVADLGTNTVYRFDAAGKPVDFSSLGTNALTGSATPAKSFLFSEAPGSPAAIAVDNSTSPSDPSAGDLYVMDAGTGHKVVDKFNAKGEYLSQIAGPFSSEELMGLGVDASGNVLVEVQGAGPGVHATEVFDDSAANSFVKSLVSYVGGDIHAFAPGSLPFSDYALSSCGCALNFQPIGGYALGQVDNGSTGVALALDRVTGHLYIDDQSSVSEWDTGTMNGPTEPERGTGTLVSSFGSLLLAGSSGQGGIAVDGVSGNVYVANPAEGNVLIFASTAPVAVAAPPTDVTKTEATLHGTVDPKGGEVTSCKFEYGTGTSNNLTIPLARLDQSVSCEQSAAQIGTGTTPVEVSAHITGLQSGSLYRFRLVATNAAGAAPSAGMFPTAAPGFGIKNFNVLFLNQDGTPDTQAGSHPYEVVNDIEYNTQVIRLEPNNLIYIAMPDDNVKDVTVHLPPGFYGDPNATAKKCSLELLSSGGLNDDCPEESQVGTLGAEVNEGYLEPNVKPATFIEPLSSIAPPPGVAFQVAGHLLVPNVFIDFGLPAGGDSGLSGTAEGIPVTAPLFKSLLTVFGVPPHAAVKPLLTMPSSCNGPLKSTISADSYQEPGHFVTAPPSVTRNAAGAPAGMTGCSKLLFPPSISVAPDVPDASTASGLTVGVHVSQKAALNPTGLAESGVRDLTVTLPEGVAINPAGADGLESCSEGLAGFTGFAEFNPTIEPGDRTATFVPELPVPLRPGANFCGDGSKIGTVRAKTPLLEHELEGAVYLAAQNQNPFGSLIAIYLIMEDPFSGTIIKLTGEVSLSATGQIVATLKNMPDDPFEEAELHFFGGERAPLTTPSRCGTYTTVASYVPWDGNGPVQATSSFQITSGPNGTPCPGASLPFKPTLNAGTTSNQAGGFSPFTMTMSRKDGEQNLQAIGLHMPPGLSGLLTGLKLCGEAEGNAGTCGPESEIGETIVSVGVGGKPFSVTGGKVFITGPYEGAPFGLSIVNPAKAGPYDLGQVVVRAKIEVDPLTASLVITSDNTGPYKIPTILDGIPLEIQHVSVTINRHGFTFNPTDCNPMQIKGSLSSTEGAVSALSVPLQATNCAVLGFKPGFHVSTSGKTSRKDGASLSVKLTYPSGALGKDANIKSVKVDLPRQLPSRLTTLQKACTAATFEANPAGCPVDSRVGHAKALTPLVPVPLEGPAYFVSYGGAKFPELVVVLQGYGVTIDLHGETFINKAGITSSTFHAIPDAPVGSFELNLPQGKYSALAANGNLCESKLAMPTAFTAQNGAEIHESTKIGVTGCAKVKKKGKKSDKHHKGKTHGKKK